MEIRNIKLPKKDWFSVGQFMLVLLLFFFSSQPSFAQSKSSKVLIEEQLIGEWILDHNASASKLTPEAKSMMAKMDVSTRNYAKSTFENQKFIFREDGFFNISQQKGHIVSGKWSISDSGNEIILSYDSGSSRKYRVVRNSKKKLILLLKENLSQTTPMLREWHLIKQAK